MPLWPRKAAVSPAPARADDLKAAYDRGRRDERAARARHPILMTGLVVLAAAGASLITLAAVNGSFSNGGEVADQKLAAAAERAAPVLQDAAVRTSDAAREAGAELKDKGRDLLGDNG